MRGMGEHVLAHAILGDEYDDESEDDEHHDDELGDDDRGNNHSSHSPTANLVIVTYIHHANI